MIDLEQRSLRAVRTCFQSWQCRGANVMHRLVLMLAVAALAGLATTTAEAGCPNHCAIEPDLAGTISEPPLPSCVTITPNASICMCNFSLRVKNECDDPVRAVDFMFDQCSGVGGGVVDYGGCGQLAKDRQGTVWFHLQAEDGIGPKEERMNLRMSGVDHTITLRANVTEFIGSDTGCAVSSAPVSGRAGCPWFVAAGVLAAALLRRRASPKLFARSAWRMGCAR